MEEKNTVLKVLVALLTILLLGSIGYIAYDKIILDKKDNDEVQETDNEKNEDQKEENKDIVILSKLLYDSANNYSDLTFEYNGETYNVNIETYNVNAGNRYTKAIFINDKDIYSITGMGISKVYSIGDLLAIYQVGTDVRGNELVFIDFYGNIVKSLKNIILENLVMNISSVKDNIEMENNTIMLKTTAYSHGPSLVFTDGEWIDVPLDDDTKSKYNITDDTITTATYQFKYLGNSKFSDMEIIDSETYGNFIKNNY